MHPELLRSDNVRRAIAERLGDSRVSSLVLATWVSWDNGSKGTSTKTRLEPCRDELLRSFDRKPFSDTFAFTTYDWPQTALDLHGWTAAVVEGFSDGWVVPATLKPDAVKARITQLVPRMNDNPQTEEMLETVILPFRIFVQAQVVAFAVDEAIASSDSLRAALSVRSDVDRDRILTRAVRNATVLSLAQQHALAHQDGGEETVLAIDRLRAASDLAGLQQLRSTFQSPRRDAPVWRYLRYVLLTTSEAEKLSNEEFAAQLEPLARDGLAFALYDLGVLRLDAARAALRESLRAKQKSWRDEDEGKGSIIYTAAAAQHLLSSVTEKHPGAVTDAEATALELLGRAAALGVNDAQIALGSFHLERARLIVRRVSLQDPDKTSSTSHRADINPISKTAWYIAVRFHTSAALAVVSDLAENVAPTWNPETHDDLLAAAKDIAASASGLRKALRELVARGGDTKNYLNPWITSVLRRRSSVTRLLRYWRWIVLAAAVSGAALVYDTVTNQPEGTCATRQQSAAREALRARYDTPPDGVVMEEEL